jgi:hypothetical protein
MNKKVLFFDSWKGGVHNFYRIFDQLIINNYDVILVHLGSWGNEKEYEKQEIYKNLILRDISYYDNSFKNVIKIEKPDLVLFLSIHTFAHRAFIKYCKYFSIPTILMYHGLIRVQDVDDKHQGAYEFNFFSYSRRVINAIPKLFIYTFPNYIISLLQTNASLKEWNSFFISIYRYIFKPSMWFTYKETNTDYCIVYASADFKHAIDFYGFSLNKIFAVGNPDLIDFYLPDDFNKKILDRNVIFKDNVLYIDTALFPTGMVYKNENTFINHIIKLNNQLILQNKNLLFKPHPETLRMVNMESLKMNGVELVNNQNFVEKLETCCLVITEPSTLSLIPCLLKIPLALANFDDLINLRFGSVLKEYPLSFSLQKLENLQRDLNSLHFSNSELNNWIEKYSGPQPAKLMPNRVVDIINMAINNKN